MTDLIAGSGGATNPHRQALTVRITEIFYSLQGEGRYTGLPTVFVRLTGCPLRCRYCDTEYAFEGGTSRLLADVVTEVGRYRARYVCVTGGEPLAQKEACLQLLRLLCDQRYKVSLETSGALSIAEIDPRVCIVMDLKTPASGEQHRNRYANLPLLKAKDQLKFVLCNRDDYEWAKARLQHYALPTTGVELLFSPAYGEVTPADLAAWILADGLPVRMQLQLHKQIWGDTPGT